MKVDFWDIKGYQRTSCDETTNKVLVKTAFVDVLGKLNSNLNFGMATYRDMKLSGKDNRGLFILFFKSNRIW